VRFFACWAYGCAALLLVLGVAWIGLLGVAGWPQAAVSLAMAAIVLPGARVLQMTPTRRWWSRPALATLAATAFVALFTSIAGLAEGADIVAVPAVIGSAVLAVAAPVALIRLR
jgi:hypothetical protein